MRIKVSEEIRRRNNTPATISATKIYDSELFERLLDTGGKEIILLIKQSAWESPDIMKPYAYYTTL